MSIEYLDRYNIIETYKDNHRQKILIASTKDERKEAVIINIIKNSEAFEGLEAEALNSVFLNLLDFQKNAEEVILVGALKDALPLDTYLISKNPTAKDRMDLIYAYLKSITRYDCLREDFINQLVDEGQLVVDKGEIALDELIILPEEGLEEQSSVIEKIIRVVEKIYDIEASEYVNYVYREQIDLFKAELLGAEAPVSLNDIFKSFRKRYIYAYCLEGFEEPQKSKMRRRGQRPDVNDILGTEGSIDRSLSRQYKGLLAIGLVFVLVLSVFAGHRLLFNDNDQMLEAPSEKLPLPYFDVVQRDGEWEFINRSEYEGFLQEQLNISWEVSRGGELIKTFQRQDLRIAIDEPGIYMVTLIIRDLYESWQREYSEEIIVQQKASTEAVNRPEEINFREDLLDKAQLQQGFFAIDTERLRNDSPTYKISEAPTTIQLQTRGIQKDALLSLWVLMESQEGLEIKITGYKNKLMEFQEIIKHRPKAIGYWEMLQFNLQESDAEQIAIDLMNFTSPLWLDDLQLSTGK